ncbi:hypothetical protein EV356DRAFT_514644 [Viridothelium virens]|uniref:Uncharacterized protein n=1 Tax=Viridothelium virens TaxID=1048519 RepID=A0A6A6HAF2_VIRVR|nr:hypothetical protein EV356DRAFT_514644 [Viridothelium virens]
MKFHRLSVLSALTALTPLTFTNAEPRPQGPVPFGSTPSSYNQTGPGNSTSNSTYLQIPAVVTDSDGNSQFQCWQLNSPFTSTPFGSNGSQLGFGDVSGASITVQPPDSNTGVHTTSMPALLHVLSGLLSITLPNNSTSTAWVLGGVSGSLILADTTGSGHNTSHPSDESTVIITMPFAGAVIPAHTIVGYDVCSTNLGALGQAT